MGVFIWADFSIKEEPVDDDESLGEVSIGLKEQEQ